jgi:6-phosphogluconolactonase
MPADAPGTPVFDLVVVGVGPDGHVLSVFPGSAVWDSAATCVAVPAPTHIEPHVARVTLHPRALAAARSVLVVAAGASKAANLGRAWTGDDVRELPVRAARLGTATWILDEAAAAQLPRE